MKVAFDTDAFCKLGAADLLEAAASAFGERAATCGRLPALPYMLERGTLQRRYGPDVCGRLLPIVRSMRSVAEPSAASLEPMLGLHGVDPGEAQLFAVCAEAGITIITGDRRAVCALRGVPALVPKISGRIVVLEALLLHLCAVAGAAAVRRKAATVAQYDTMLECCFSPNEPEPERCLRSYFDRLKTDASPLALWSPQ